MTNESLIEHLMPVGVINTESRREKSGGRHFHISTLHPWWARRPLAAMRAATLASLVPRDRFPQDVTELEGFFQLLARWRGDEVGLSPSALEQARQMIKDNHAVRPRVIDSFGGGCAGPLEATRLGCDASAVELNPVAYLVGMASVVWPQLFGAGLADDVLTWANWVREETFGEVSDLYPSLDPGASPSGNGAQLLLGGEAGGTGRLSPLAYLWTRTVLCPNPQREPHEVPLIRSKHVVRKAGRRIGIRVVPDPNSMTFHFDFVEEHAEPETERRSRTSSSGCPLCGTAISSKYLKHAGDEKKIRYQLVGVVLGTANRQGKRYVPADQLRDAIPNGAEIERRLESLARAGLTVPDDEIQPMGNAGLKSGNTYLYGIHTFGDLFTGRQLVTLLTLCKNVRAAHGRMLQAGMSADRAAVVAAYLGLIVDRVVDRSTTLARWNVGGEKAESPWQRDRLAMIWDFVEVNPFAGISGDYSAAAESVAKVIRHCARAGGPADLRRASATELPFADASFDAAIIDPPYYDNISYANSSDFYYVWLKRSIGDLFPEHLGGPVAPKRSEIIAASYRHGRGKEADELARKEYEQLMTGAFEELRRVLKPGGLLVTVYAHQTTAGWSTLIRSLRSAGFAVAEAWPVETEMAERRGGQENASLASSIFLAARRRETESLGEWTKVQADLEKVVKERVRTLPEAGITGSDLVIATVGAGLGPYTAYHAVELPNGELLEPEDFLREVQTLVLKSILSELMGVDRSGVEAVDPVTQLYIVGRFEYGDAFVPYDELNMLVHGVMAGGRTQAVELLGPRGLVGGGSALIEKEKDSVRFRDFEDRGSNERLGVAAEGVPAPLIDVLHRLLWLAQHQPRQVKDFLMIVNPDAGQLQLLAQGLSGASITEKGLGTSDRERGAIANVLGSWKRLVEDNLFRGQS